MKRKAAAIMLCIGVLLATASCGKSSVDLTVGASTAAVQTATNSDGEIITIQQTAGTGSQSTTSAVTDSVGRPVVPGATKTQSATKREFAYLTTTKPITTSAQKAPEVPSDYPNSVTEAVSVNQIGYAQRVEKTAISNGISGKFYLINATTNKVVYTADTSAGNYDETNRITVYTFDFSSVTAAGTYYIHTPKGRTYPFFINAKPYQSVSDSMIKALYYQRCGCELKSQHAGKYTHPACHNTIAELITDSSVKVNTFGGWHDAGDYGKYVTPANVTLLQMFYAYELFSGGISNNLNIPESGDSTPDILDEARYELEWLLKMQAPSGGVYHKVTTANFAGTVMPQFDVSQQYLSPISLTASAGFAAATAAASRMYKNIDPVFSAKCLAAAKRAYDFSNANENMSGFHNPAGISTGVYGDNNANDELYLAAAELFRATGEQKYNTRFKALRSRNFDSGAFSQWAPGAIANICYCLTTGADSSLKSTILTEIVSAADTLMRKSADNAYGISLSKYDYFWGSNGALMNRASLMCAAAALTKSEKYDDCIANHISYLFGRNILSQCYVTGFGSKSVRNPHHRPSQADNIAEPVPGFVAGGPDDRLEDETMKKLYTQQTKPSPAACYVDNQWSYSTNEITIYWNSAAFFATVYFNTK